jgi:NADH-quinone oxidoreductase subunit H
MIHLSAQFFVSLVLALTLFLTFQGLTAYLIMLERKIASYVQDRVGPNRVGFTFGLVGDNAKKRHFGLGQPLADGVKFLVKEDYSPRNVDRGLFLLAPALAVIPAMFGWAVIPWGGAMEIGGFTALWGLFKVDPGIVTVSVAPVNIGVIFILAISSLAVYGVVLGAWAANNKYTFLGGLRATAQMLSYEIPMGIGVLIIILMAGSSDAAVIVNDQADNWWGLWYIVQQPLTAVLFFTCVLAETNRAPFDLAEAESELVGGYHTEYSSMKFALFFLGEYMHMITGCAFFALLFLGGWHLPGLPVEPTGIFLVLLKVGVFIAKVVALLAFMMWLRWTVPRFRFDQLMRLAWRSMIPLSLGLLLITGIFIHYGLDNWMWLGNLIVIGAALAVAPLIPSGKSVNRRVPLEGSRFSPAR